MKKIGFIDYYLSEWHADNYPAWIDEVSAKKGFDYRVEYAYAERDISPRDGISTEEWCARFGIERCENISELCERSDCVVILSPDNPERHLKYALEVIPFGKPTYVDKTFATTLKEAKSIFAAAEECFTPISSTSALRFADELNDFRADTSGEVAAPVCMATGGAGSSYDNYAVHQIEMMVTCMGCSPRRIMGLLSGAVLSFVVEFEGERRATFTQHIGSSAPFSISLPAGDAADYRVIKSDFFGNFIREMLLFFESGRPMATRDETLAVIAIIEAGREALGRPGEWVEIKI